MTFFFALIKTVLNLAGRLQSVVDGRPFEYHVYADPAANKQRYCQIGRLVERSVYELLIKDCGLHKQSIPVSSIFHNDKKFPLIHRKDRCETQ